MRRELDKIENEIKCISGALPLTPDGHPNLPFLLAGLGASHEKRFQLLGELSDLEKAIEYESRALALLPDGHPELLGRLDNLGACHSNRFRLLGELFDLEKAIEYESRVLTLTPSGHPDWLGRLDNLGASYYDRYERLGELGDLETAIEHAARALALTPDGHPELLGRLDILGVSHSDRYRRLGELSDLEQAIECKSRVLALTPDDHPDLPSRFANLGVSYSHRFQRMGEPSDLETAIDYTSRALDLTPDSHPDWLGRLDNLGVSYGYRYQRLGELEDLDRAIEYASRALALTPDGHPDLPNRLSNLGRSHNNRFQRLGDLDDLEKAIEYESRALALTPDGHPELPGRFDDLAVSYNHRYQRLGEQNDRQAAIGFKSRACALTPNGHQGETNSSAKVIANNLTEVNHSPLSHQAQNVLMPPTSKTSPLSFGFQSNPSDGGQVNITPGTDRYEEPILRDTPISKQMTVNEVILHLVAHGCRDLINEVDHGTFSENPIYHGGFSDIYHGCLLNKTQVAIKSLRISMNTITKDSKHLKHAARELHTWGKCNHPNVLKLHGLIVFRGRIGMVSPWMKRGSLPLYLEQTPGVDRCNLCLQICNGLSYMHQIGIIHGDLKGANILISDDGSPVLTDFGNSLYKDQTMKFTETTSSGSFTIRWSAPELLDGSGVHSEASDVYALAMTIYEVLAGTLPYEGKTVFAIMNIVVTQKKPPERPKSIAAGREDGDKLWNLLLRCWSFEPTARPSAKEVAEIMKTITPSSLCPIGAPM